MSFRKEQQLNVLHRNILQIARKLRKKKRFFELVNLFDMCCNELPNPEPEIDQAIRDLYIWKYIRKGKQLFKEDILKNEKRKNIYDYIGDNPGAHEREIREANGLGAYMAYRHLNFLEKYDFVRMVRYKNKKTYFPIEFAESKELEVLILKDKTNYLLYECIQEYGQIQLKQLSSLLEIPYTTVQSHLEQMVEAGLINKVIQDNFPYYKLRAAGVGDEPIEIKREFDFVGGMVRFKVAIRNLSDMAINNIAAHLNPSEQFEMDISQQIISYLSPNTTRGLDFMLTPLTCGRGKIFGSITFEDAYGTVHSLPIQPKEINIKCPLVQPKIASQEEVNQWIQNLKRASSKVNFQNISREEAFRLGRQQVSALDLNEVIVKQGELWGLYSGLVKVTGQNMVVKISIADPNIVLDVWADDMKQTTGFLAYITNLINLALESSYKMFQKTEALARKLATLLKAATVVDNIFKSSEKLELVVTLSGDLEKLEHYLVNASCDTAFIHSVEDVHEIFRSNLNQELPVEETVAIDLRFKSLKWLRKIHEVIQYHTKTYKDTFDDLSAISGKLETGITLVGEKIKKFEKMYGQSVLSYLLILDKESGLTLFERNLGDLPINPDLVGGFLHALQSFGQEIDRQESSMRTLTYEKYQFQIETGAHVRVALILRGTPNEYIILRLKEFVSQFEINFEDDISTFTGNMEVFQPANALFDVIFK